MMKELVQRKAAITVIEQNNAEIKESNELLRK